MKFRLLLALIACLLTPLLALADTPVAPHGFTVDQFIAVTLEYKGRNTVVGVDTYGPTDKAYLCNRSAAAAIAEAHHYMPKGHELVATCLHVLFGGPLPNGAAVVIPSKETPPEYVTVAVEYGRHGRFIGAQALHMSLIVKTCMAESEDLLKSNYSLGRVARGRSLILYCVPAPKIPSDAKGHSV